MGLCANSKIHSSLVVQNKMINPTGSDTSFKMKLHLVLFACLFQHSCSTLTQVTTENYDATIPSGKWMVMFSAPWCPACQGIDPVWNKFSDHMILKEKGIQVARVNVSSEPAISGQYLIFNLPTVYFLKDGEAWPYTGQRNYDAFVKWVEDEAWRQEKPVEWWRAPNSFNMRMVGRFFHFANSIRGYHQQLIDEYGMPFWVAYTVFAVLTIFIGITIGMFFVCLCDLICPPKSQPIKYKKPPRPQPIQERDDEDDQSDLEDKQVDQSEEDLSEAAAEEEPTPKDESSPSKSSEAQAGSAEDQANAGTSSKGRTVRQRKGGKSPKKR